MRGRIPKVYMGIAIGSPWVVPSQDEMTSPSTNNLEGCRYVLMTMGAKDGQSC